MHLHLLLMHEHEGKGAHQHVAAVHWHADIPDGPGETSDGASADEHRHHVPLIQIVAVEPLTLQAISYVIAQLEVFTLPNTGPSPVLEFSCWFSFTDTSPPFKLQLTKDISGRSPPLL